MVDILIKAPGSEVDVVVEVAPFFLFRPISAPVPSLKLEMQFLEYFSKSIF